MSMPSKLHPSQHHRPSSNQSSSNAALDALKAAEAPRVHAAPPHARAPCHSSAMASIRLGFHLLLTIITALSAALAVVGDDRGISETAALRSFLQQFDIDGNNALNKWNMQTPYCDWTSIECMDGGVSKITFNNLGLHADNPRLDALKNLTGLRSLSLQGNKISGSFPDISFLPSLRNLFISNNKFGGKIPDDAFAASQNLKKLELDSNNFSGAIPSSLTKLTKLLELRIDNNRFEGPIPDLPLHELKSVNVSSNQLSGPIPRSFGGMSTISFQNNKGLCGPPLKNPCSAASPPPLAATDVPQAAAPEPHHRTRSKLSTIIVGIAVVIAVVALAAICALLFIILRSHRRSSMATLTPPQPVEAPAVPNAQKKASPEGQPPHSSAGGAGKKAEAGKLCFLAEKDGAPKFELADLLKASAEILGSGSFGSSYKAALLGGPVMVVKRFRQMNNVNKEDFQEHMRRLGRLKHPNLLSVVAYYYRKEEKLLVTDFVQNGSLAVRLHGYRSQGHPSLDWPTRLRILKGVAKGLCYLFNELPSLVTSHGHLKSSNVLLNETLDPVLTDYALVPVTNQEQAQHILVAYKSPEYRRNGRLNKKTDVWSLGILILEILTGRVSARFLHPSNKGENGGGEDSAVDDDLARWVRSMAAEGDHTELFDKSMKKMCQAEMVKLLDIGLSCCEEDVEKRLDMREASERIEDLRDSDEDFFSTCASTDRGSRSSRRLSGDFT